MTKDNWIKAFRKTFGLQGATNVHIYQGYVDELEAFISQVEKDAEERGYQLGLRDGIKKENESSGAWTDLNKQGVINTHKLIKDAIEKTNKRWRERFDKVIGEYQTNKQDSWALIRNELRTEQRARLSDLLEDKK